MESVRESGSTGTLREKGERCALREEQEDGNRPIPRLSCSTAHQLGVLAAGTHPPLPDISGHFRTFSTRKEVENDGGRMDVGSPARMRRLGVGLLVLDTASAARIISGVESP